MCAILVIYMLRGDGHPDETLANSRCRRKAALSDGDSVDGEVSGGDGVTV